MMTIQSAASGIFKACVTFSVLLVGPAIAAAPAAPASFPISDASFKCIAEMTHVRHFYVDNLAGNLDGTVKVAQQASGDYPVGSVLQLVPTEVMIKRQKGFNAGTRDWEFFELTISPTSSTIRVRGVQDVSAEDAAALGQLGAIVKALAAAQAAAPASEPASAPKP